MTNPTDQAKLTAEDWVVQKWLEGLPTHRRGELAQDDIASLRTKVSIAIRVAEDAVRKEFIRIAQEHPRVCSPCADEIAQAIREGSDGQGNKG